MADHNANHSADPAPDHDEQIREHRAARDERLADVAPESGATGAA